MLTPPRPLHVVLPADAIVLIDDVASFENPSKSELDLYIDSLNADAAKQQAEQEAANKKSKAAAIQKLLRQESGTHGSDPLPSGASPKEAASLQKAIAKRKAREEKRQRELAVKAGSDDPTSSMTPGSNPNLHPNSDTNSSLKSNPNSNATLPEGVIPSSSEPGSATSLPSADQVQGRRREEPLPSLSQRDEWGQLDFPPSYHYVTPSSALEPPLPMDWYHPGSPLQPEGQAGEGGKEEGRMLRVYPTLSSAKQAGLWHYPRTAEQRARCAVFESLLDRGYYMSTGLRFGGDFNVYPGDPLRYHSHFTATVKASPTASLSALELIANGRLSTAVKKAHLIAACDGVRDEPEAAPLDWEDTVEHPFGSVEYFSLTWAGFGT